MKIAKTIPEILSQTDKKILGRARGVNPTLKGQEGKVVQYEVKGSKAYTIDVEFRGNHVKVRCSCDAFVFQGSEYHANKQKFLYGKAKGNLAEPTKRDPEGKNLVCKHIVAVFDNIVGSSIQRVASRYLFDT
jgi:hypothetical protein